MDTDTLQLIPNMTPILVYTEVDVVKQAVSDILHVLKNSAKNNLPTVLKGDAIQNAFKQIADLLGNNEVLAGFRKITEKQSTKDHGTRTEGAI